MGGYDLMLHRTLFIGRWVADFIFAPDGYDIGEVTATLYDMGASDSIVGRTVDLMTYGGLNTGFTFTNADNLSAIVVIGPTSSRDEFINTLVHEVHHLAVAIAENLGIDLESETPAYLAGDSAQRLADLVCELGCPHCGGKYSC